MRAPCRRRRPFLPALACALLAGCAGAPGPAPITAAAAGNAAGTAGIAPAPGAPYGGTCTAGFYGCLLPASLPVGTGCSCPGLGAPSHGVVR